MKYRLMIALIVSSILSNGQNKKFEELSPDIEWGEGSILLNSGEELTGLVRFNDRIGVLSYEGGDDRGSYSPRTVSGFEFFDARQKRQRVYYTIEFEDSKTNVKRPLFFEVLKDFQSFAVIAKIDPVEMKEMTTYENGINSTALGSGITSTTMKIYQTETIYFLSTSGLIEPYLKLTRKVVDGQLYDREKMKRKFVDDELMAKYFKEPGRTRMIKFAEENNLQFDRKEDLIKIIAVYSDTEIK